MKKNQTGIVLFHFQSLYKKTELKKKSMVAKNRNIFTLDHVCAVCVGVCMYMVKKFERGE